MPLPAVSYTFEADIPEKGPDHGQSGNPGSRCRREVAGPWRRYEERRNILRSTGFVVKPDRTIVVSQYSSGPIGRLVWQDVLGLVQFYKKSSK